MRKKLRTNDKQEIKAIIDALRINAVDYINSDDPDSGAKLLKVELDSAGKEYVSK